MSDIVEQIRPHHLTQGMVSISADKLRRAADEIKRLRKLTEWQPIETAPKDGTEILGGWSYMYPGDKAPTTGVEIIHWNNKAWQDWEGSSHPELYKHWQPLPTPPTE